MPLTAYDILSLGYTATGRDYALTPIHGVALDDLDPRAFNLFRLLAAVGSGYVRLRPMDPIQEKQMILTYAETYGSITRGQAMELCRVGATQARSLLKSMVTDGDLVLHGELRGAHYKLPEPS